MSDKPHPPLNTDDHSCLPLVAGAALACHDCTAALCLRQQVINLALGNTDEMFCLGCLAKENDQTPAEVLQRVMQYIQGRDCFRKEWIRYADVSFCPDRDNCLPRLCFPEPSS